MGNPFSCCLKLNASPNVAPHSKRVKWKDEVDFYEADTRNPVAVPPAPASLEPSKLEIQECDSHQVMHISDLEMPKELALEQIPSDHPRESTIFLKRSQMHVQGKRKSYSYHVSPGHLSEKSSSCSTIFLDDCTISKPNFRMIVRCLALAIHYHMKTRDANRFEDIFDERLHPITQERFPEEYFNHDPEPECVYQFVHILFAATGLGAECAITTLVYIERLLVYAEIDICPPTWKRLVLVTTVLACKYLNDLAIYNSDICLILQGITLEDMNELERHVLGLLAYHLTISASVYTKYYFDLRSLARDHGLPMAFAPLTKERAQNLEAFFRYCENQNLSRVAIRKSSSCDNFTAMQCTDAILS